MKKIIYFLTATIILTFWLSQCSVGQNVGERYRQAYHTYCVQDSTLGVTRETLLDVSGPGVLKQLSCIVPTDATAQMVVEVTLDGTTHADSVSSSTTTVHYWVIDNTPSQTTTEDAFMLSTTYKALDIEFKNNMKIVFRAATSSTVSIKADYMLPGTNQL